MHLGVGAVITMNCAASSDVGRVGQVLRYV